MHARTSAHHPSPALDGTCHAPRSRGPQPLTGDHSRASTSSLRNPPARAPGIPTTMCPAPACPCRWLRTQSPWCSRDTTSSCPKASAPAGAARSCPSARGGSPTIAAFVPWVGIRESAPMKGFIRFNFPWRTKIRRGRSRFRPQRGPSAIPFSDKVTGVGVKCAFKLRASG